MEARDLPWTLCKMISFPNLSSLSLSRGTTRNFSSPLREFWEQCYHVLIRWPSWAAQYVGHHLRPPRMVSNRNQQEGGATRKPGVPESAPSPCVTQESGCMCKSDFWPCQSSHQTVPTDKGVQKQVLSQGSLSLQLKGLRKTECHNMRPSEKVQVLLKWRHHHLHLHIQGHWLCSSLAWVQKSNNSWQLCECDVSSAA